MNSICYANGQYLPKDKVKVGITDLVLLRGYGAFDYLRTYQGRPFRIQDYLDRFESSARGMGLRLPESKRSLSKIIHELLRRNKTGRKDVGIRLLLTGGYSLDSYLPGKRPNIFILIEKLPDYPAWWSEKGIKLMVHDHAREMARVKTTNYLTAIRLADERRRQKAQDTLYVSEGKVLETTRNNFFLFKGNKLVTSEEGVLHGITRKVVLELARKKFKVEIRPVKESEIYSCSECFITGTTRGITPVVEIGKKKIAKGRPGPNTRWLMDRFNELTWG